MNHQLDDPMLLIYQYYPAGETAKPRRRRKKKEGGERRSNSSGVVKKRKLSEEQVNLLERSFVDEQKLETERKDKLASELCLDPQQVAVWFQNRRARWKNKKLEEEYSNLKAQDHTAIVDKCRLETEVLKMKEQLCEAEKEIQRLLLERNCVGLTSSMEQPHFLMDNVLFVADDYYITLWDN